MFFKTLLTAIALLLFTSCSSSNDPKEIALQLCEYNKVGDIESIKEYASDELKVQLGDLETMLTMAKKTKEGRDLIQQQEKYMETINCQETTKVSQEEDGSFRVSNAKIELDFKLKMQDGSWKMFK